MKVWIILACLLTTICCVIESSAQKNWGTEKVSLAGRQYDFIHIERRITKVVDARGANKTIGVLRGTRIHGRSREIVIKGGLTEAVRLFASRHMRGTRNTLTLHIGRLLVQEEFFMSDRLVVVEFKGAITRECDGSERVVAELDTMAFSKAISASSGANRLITKFIYALLQKSSKASIECDSLHSELIEVELRKLTLHGPEEFNWAKLYDGGYSEIDSIRKNKPDINSRLIRLIGKSDHESFRVKNRETDSAIRPLAVVKDSVLYVNRNQFGLAGRPYLKIDKPGRLICISGRLGPTIIVHTGYGFIGGLIGGIASALVSRLVAENQTIIFDVLTNRVYLPTEVSMKRLARDFGLNESFGIKIVKAPDPHYFMQAVAEKVNKELLEN